MPINCPKLRSEYNACLSCRHRQGNECWANYPAVIRLSDILTIGERVSIIEDRKEASEPAWDTSQWDYVLQLKGQVVFLTNKVNELLTRKPKRKSKYS